MVARRPGLRLRSSPTGANCRSGEEPGIADAGAASPFGRPAFVRDGLPTEKAKGLRILVPVEPFVRLEEAHCDLHSFQDLLGAIESIHERIQTKGGWFPDG